jgi:hypothetical protein
VIPMPFPVIARSEVTPLAAECQVDQIDLFRTFANRFRRGSEANNYAFELIRCIFPAAHINDAIRCNLRRRGGGR